MKLVLEMSLKEPDWDNNGKTKYMVHHLKNICINTPTN